MDTIFMSSKNSTTSNPHRPLNLTEKIGLKKSDKYCFIKPLHLIYM